MVAPDSPPEDPSPSLAERVAAVGVFLATFVVYVSGLAPAPYWLDSSELAAASFVLGVAHPPGHPLAVLAGKLAALLPFGSIAFRVGLASAIATSAAAALVCLLAAWLVRRVGAELRRRDDPMAAILAAGCSLGFALAWATAFQAVRPEVYALNAALVLLAAYGLARWRNGDDRWLHLAALGLGLALTNHHFVAGLFALVAGVFVLVGRGRERAARRLGIAVGLGALGLLTYLYLPLRAAHWPLVDWGAPSTLSRFVWTVTAKAFQRSLSHVGQSSGFDVLAAVAQQLVLLTPLALMGLYVVVRFGGIRPVGVLLAVGAAAVVASPALVGFDRQNPDAYGYLEPALGFLAATAATAPAVILLLVRSRWVARAAALVLMVLVLVPMASGAGSARRSRFYDADWWSRELLDGLPPRGLLITSQFQSAFLVWYRQGVEGRRPDVSHLHRHFLSFPGYREQVERRLPGLVPLLGEHDVVTPAVLARAATVPVWFEYDLDVDERIARRLQPGRAIEVLSPTVDGRSEAGFFDREIPTALHLDETQTLRALLWKHYLDAVRDCRLRRPGVAESVRRARALIGNRDTDLESLARACLGPNPGLVGF